MKPDLHPEYAETTVHCVCGNSWTTRSTVKGTLNVDICSACHPFYTGKQKLVDTAGRVERYRKRWEKTEARKAAAGTDAESAAGTPAPAGTGTAAKPRAEA